MALVRLQYFDLWQLCVITITSIAIGKLFPQKLTTSIIGYSLACVNSVPRCCIGHVAVCDAIVSEMCSSFSYAAQLLVLR